MNENDPKDNAVLQYEPTGVPEYEHDLYNETNKEKARKILDDLMFDYLSKGGEIKKLPLKKD